MTPNFEVISIGTLDPIKRLQVYRSGDMYGYIWAEPNKCISDEGVITNGRVNVVYSPSPRLNKVSRTTMDLPLEIKTELDFITWLSEKSNEQW